LDIKSRRFKAVDILLLTLTVLPLLGAVVLQVLTKAPSEGISISGARIFLTLPFPIQDLILTEAQINSWLLILSLLFLCLYLSHGFSPKAQTKRQLLIEWAFDALRGMVDSNMGSRFMKYIPFVASLMVLSCLSSLLSLIGLFPPTSDLNVTAGWALLVFALITYYKFKCGPWGYVKSFAEPVAVLFPMNLISEVATPVSMAFRHYGNILSGSIISVLIGAAFQGLSALVLGWLPGALGDVPFLQIGVPAVLSLYFDVVSGLLQAYIFASLTMLYVSSAFNEDEFEARRRRKAQSKQKTV